MGETDSGPGRREALGAALACAAGAVLLFAAPLFGGRSTLSFELSDPRLDVRPWARPAPAGEALPRINPLTPDIDMFVLPGMVRIRQLAQQGAPPWWDGGQLLGYPLLANLPSPIFLPTVWPTFLVGPVTALDLLLALHTAIAAFLAWRAARMLGAGTAAAAVAAVGFPLTAWMTTRWHLPHIHYTTAWWPGALCALEWLRRGRRARGVAEGGLFLGLAMLSGFPQVGMLLALGTLALVVLHPDLRRRATLAGAGLAVLLGLLLSAPQLAVSGSAFAGSLRVTDVARAATARQVLAPGALAGALFPEFFGRPSDFAPPAPPLQDWLPQRLLLSDAVQDNPVENALYPGLLLLLLAPVLLRRRRDDGRAAPSDRTGRALLALGAGAVLACLAWGPLLAAAPALAKLGAANTKRLAVLWAAALPFVGALSLQALLDGRARLPVATGAVLLALVVAAPLAARALDDPAAPAFVAALDGQALRQGTLLLGCLFGTALAVRSPRFAWLPALLLAVDLATAAWAFNPFPRQHEPFPATASLRALAGRQGRVAVLGTPNVLPGSAAATAGLRCVHGVAPMVPARAAELLGCVEPGLVDPEDPRVVRPFTRRESLTHPVLDLLGVDTVVHADPGLAAATGWEVLFEHEQENLAALARPGAMPRAFLCGGARVVAGREERLRWLADPAAPVRRTVLLEEAPELALPQEGELLPARVTASRADRHAVSIDAPFAGVLVLTEGVDPGWTATVDGRPARVHAVDHALLGVVVPAGAHEVVFGYHPPGLLPTLPLALAALGALALLAWRVRRGDPLTPAR
jgi:hypothetical protein